MFIGITQTSTDHYVFLLHVPKFNFAYHDITVGCYGNRYTTIHQIIFFLPLKYSGKLFAFKCQSNKRNHKCSFSHQFLKWCFVKKKKPNLLVSNDMLGFKRVALEPQLFPLGFFFFERENKVHYMKTHFSFLNINF